MHDERNPFQDIQNHVDDRSRRNLAQQPQPIQQQRGQSHPVAPRSEKIQLPDVTGLTNAVESPAKGRNTHRAYDPSGREAKAAEGW